VLFRSGAGSHTFSATFTPADTANYNTVTKNLTVTVAKATRTAADLSDAEKPTPAADLIEEPEAQALLTAPEKLPEGYTAILYRADGGDWSENIPQGREAKDHTVETKYAGDADHEDFEGVSFTVSIQKAVYVFSLEENETLGFTKKSAKDLTATVVQTGAPDASFEHFSAVLIDGTPLVKDEDYTVEKGSTVVTVAAAALEKLEPGAHTLTVRFTNGEASAELTVRPAPPRADQTGDDARVFLRFSLAGVSLLAALAFVFLGRKKKASGR
jgi:hypothetical protein